MTELLVDAFLQAATTALHEMTGAPVQVGARTRQPIRSAPDDITALVALVGRINGLILTAVNTGTAARLAGADLPAAGGRASRLLDSAVAELANLVAAGGASRLADHGLEATVTVPQVVRRDETFVSAPIHFEQIHLTTVSGPVQVLIGVRGVEQRQDTAGLQAIEHGPLTVLGTLNRQRITVYLQPLVSVTSGQVAGYEGLLRGPAGTPVERPDELFRAAEEAGVLYVLERLARSAALDVKRTLVPGSAKLFLNVDARVPLLDQACPLTELFADPRLHPADVVLEVTERTVLNRSPDFLEALARFRAAGGQVALDDLGAGYSGLKTVLAVRPDYMKLDMELVRGIDRSEWQQALVAGLVHFAHRVGASVVAEGVERVEELETLRHLGIDLVQGYLLARPAPTPPPVQSLPI